MEQCSHSGDCQWPLSSFVFWQRWLEKVSLILWTATLDSSGATFLPSRKGVFCRFWRYIPGARQSARCFVWFCAYAFNCPRRYRWRLLMRVRYGNFAGALQYGFVFGNTNGPRAASVLCGLLNLAGRLCVCERVCVGHPFLPLLIACCFPGAEKVNNLIESFLEQARTIILCVIPANQVRRVLHSTFSAYVRIRFSVVQQQILFVCFLFLCHAQRTDFGVSKLPSKTFCVPFFCLLTAYVRDASFWKEWAGGDKTIFFFFF